MMTTLLARREALLADAVKEFAAELLIIDPSDIIAYLRLERFAILNDLIQSSMEMYFKPGKFRFGYGGECFLTWSAPAKVSLDMEFVDADVAVQFRLLLGDSICGVSVDQISFSGSAGSAEVNTRRLEAALQDSLLQA
jgi:hypothetical protein